LAVAAAAWMTRVAAQWDGRLAGIATIVEGG
jgi:hypothetical protein